MLGYVTPFVEVVLKQWLPIWRTLSFGIVIIASVGLGLLAPRARAIWLIGLCALLYYEWGANAPGYQAWSSLVPWPIHGLLRERYAMSFVVLVMLTVLTYRGATELLALRLRLGAIAIVIAVIAAVAPFLDGHLGPFGLIRERFDAATTVTDYINVHGAGTVLTIPFGSIIKGPGWAYFGRSPFSIGGPRFVLDAEGAPSSPALPAVQALARSLPSDAALATGETPGYLRLLGVRYVVDWRQLQGDSRLDRPAVLANLVKLGARPVWSDREATLWEFPSAPIPPQAGTHYAADGLLADELFKTLVPIFLLLTLVVIGASLIPSLPSRMRSVFGGVVNARDGTDPAGSPATRSDMVTPRATPTSPGD